MSKNVLILDSYAADYAEHLRPAFPDFSFLPARTLAEAGDLSKFDILIAFGIAINDQMIGRMNRLQWIQSLATGVDHFLRCPSLRPEVLLTSMRGIHGPAMRETVAFLMLSASHDTPRLARQQAERRWDRSTPWPLLCGKTAAIVGVGISGTAIANLLKGFGMRAIGLSRTPRAVEGFDEVVEVSKLTEVAAEADYLINVLPGDPHNHDLIGRSVFEAMKSSAYFINVGRGETVDEAALIDTLRARRIAGAGLDVFRTEPLPPDSPLWDMPNVFVCSHIGGLFREYEEYALPTIKENMRLFLDGKHDEMRNIAPH
jgi:D-2-hydroxyacid dehydrogenase (NADP+)